MSRLSLMGVGAVAITGLAGSQVSSLGEVVNPPVKVSGIEANETNASASLLGQFRTSAATWLYLHADLYLHNGVEMRPLTSTERKLGRQGMAAGTSDLGANEAAGEVTVIPTPDRDFRGWIGDLERACGAYKDMKGHTHNPPETALPLFRLMTTLDPQFIPGWTMGAMLLARDTKTGPDKAVEFLKRGNKQNPAEFRIAFEIGFYYATYKKSPSDALPWLDIARNLALKRRLLAEDELDTFREDYRLLGLCLRDLNQPVDEIGIVKEGIGRFPDDPLLKRLLQAALDAQSTTHQGLVR